MGFILSPELENYIGDHTSSCDSVLQELEQETYLNYTLPQMVSGDIQGKFLEFISTMIRPSLVVEIGTFTGYSAICLAKGLTPGGKLFTIDINEEVEDTVRKYIDKAGMNDRIDFRLGHAVDIIPSLPDGIDLVFIDADKVNYSMYYDLVFPKVRTGGYILADNVLWSGKVLDEKQDKDTAALVAYSDKVQNDNRVENVMISVRDGLLLARKL